MESGMASTPRSKTFRKHATMEGEGESEVEGWKMRKHRISHVRNSFTIYPAPKEDNVNYVLSTNHFQAFDKFNYH